MKYINYYISVFIHRDTTKALFQAWVVLAACFLLGAKDQGSFLYKEESIAYELMYKVQENNNGTPLNEIDCKTLSGHVADCMLAQYKINTIESYNKAFLAILDVIYILLIFVTAGFITSFVLKPIVEFNNKNT